MILLAFHRKCIDPWLSKTKHTCPLCKKKVFRRASAADDSDSDSGSVENSSTSASERTPLLASVTVSAVTTTSAQSMCHGIFYIPIRFTGIVSFVAHSRKFHISEII